MLDRLRSIDPLFIATVIVPTFLAALYFGLLADDLYTSESRFVVRNPTQAAASPISSVLSQTGLGGRVEGNDTVIEYVQSRKALEEANEDGLVREAYSDPEIFIWDRFGAIGGDSREELYQYFLGKVGIAEGTSSQVMTISVQAFDPEDAQAINTRLLEQAETLVNSLSERSRKDSIAAAQQEVDDATAQARNAALELANFRDQRGIIDPQEQSLVGMQMISKLQDQLIAARTQLRQLQTYTPEASQIPFLRTQVAAIQQEIADTRSSLAGDEGSLSASMVRYQELRLNSEFAEKQLAVVLASLQEAQAEARRKRVYIERVSDPSLPDYAANPRRLRSVIATLIMGLLAWGVLSMLVIGIREHRD